MGGELGPRQPSFRQSGRHLSLLLKTLPGVSRRASREWMNDNAPRLGAAVAFYALLSLAPVVVIAVGVAALVYGQDAAQGRLASEIRGLAGPDVARTVEDMIKGAYQPRTGLIATLLGLATLAFSASSMFVALHDAMNTIWEVPLPQEQTNVATVIRLIRNRFYSFVAVLAIGFLLMLSLVLSAWVVAMRIAVPRGATFTITLMLVTVVFASLYKIVPDVKLKWSNVALGAGITSLLFMTGNHLMALYFAHAKYGSTYSVAGSPIVVLLWLYYSVQLFFWGAEFSKVYTQTAGAQSGPDL